jgi:hypothetical protein
LVLYKKLIKISLEQRYRNQIPLDLAFAITIYKSQGVIDLGKSENQSGCIAFVALLRLKTFEGLWLKHMPWPQLHQINKKVMIKLRIEEQKSLLRLQENLNL